MIEEGFIYDDISNAIIRAYLSSDTLKNIDSLVLGCTHYPIIKNQIRKFFDFKIPVIDSSQIVAQYLKNILQSRELLNTELKTTYDRFLISDYTDYFRHIAGLFFEEEINLTKVDFWK